MLEVLRAVVQAFNYRILFYTVIMPLTFISIPLPLTLSFQS